MGALRQQQKRAGTIHRVVRVSGRFVCGLCRNLYDHYGDAQDCLGSCWQETLAMDPVIVKHVNGRFLLRCLFCARDYQNRSAVLRCADECKRQKLRKAMAESRLSAAEPHLKTRRQVRKLRSVIIPVASIKKKIKPQKSESSGEQFNSQALEELVTRADANESPVEVGDIANVVNKDTKQIDAPKKNKPSAVFYRDQAKYVCTVCHEKYFTKIEVSNCYDGHE